MATQLTLRRGSSIESDVFTGAEGEISVDTTKSTVRVHDGVTIGGHELAKNNLSNVIIIKSLTPGTTGTLDVGTSNSKWKDLYLSGSIKLGSSRLYQDPEGGFRIESPIGSFLLDQDLSKQSSPTFSNLVVTGEIIGKVKGAAKGFSIVANETERLAVEEPFAGMIVLQKDNNTQYQYKQDGTWGQYFNGPVRKTITHSITNIGQLDSPTESVNFEFPIGKSSIIYKVTVSHPVTVEVHETTERNDTNPYRFIATEDHLIDDGSTLMSDGTVLRGRRYSIWASGDNTNNVYVKIINNELTEVQNFVITVEYTPIEFNSTV